VTPDLQTSRLVPGAPAAEDFEAFAAFAADPAAGFSAGRRIVTPRGGCGAPAVLAATVSLRLS